MPVYFEDESGKAFLLAQLRAIGWTEEDIQAGYPELLGDLTSTVDIHREQFEQRREEHAELRATAEAIRNPPPDPEERALPSGGLDISEGDPDRTIPADITEDPLSGIGDPRGRGTRYDPVYDPYATQEGPPVGSNQNADLFALALLFL